MRAAKKEDIEKIELHLFLEAMYQCYGYDFRHYAQASVKRRVRHLLAKTGYSRISEMIPPLLYDEIFSQIAIGDFSITVTEMFRDPEFYCSLRQNVAPYLKTYPFIRVWHAGCASGEEAYSLAILLQEEDLYERATIFATDFNDIILEKAKEGIYALNDIRRYTTNYQKAGGIHPFADYYHAQYESAIMNQSLKRNITFINHNLVTDGVFGEMHLIFCRNVLIYFDKMLKNRVLSLFADSLDYGGFLCLGSKETLHFSQVTEQFKVIDERAKIYQKRTR
ncbi:MAG: protein-glutamate O-methyltransferase CheR [Chloroflexi bacterium]|nr:protein-glutamate O-methyltransferase CheR [Chloroflexota bacterium]